MFDGQLIGIRSCRPNLLFDQLRLQHQNAYLDISRTFDTFRRFLSGLIHSQDTELGVHLADPRMAIEAGRVAAKQGPGFFGLGMIAELFPDPQRARKWSLREIWSWVKIQIVPPVNIPIPNKIG